MESIKPYLKIDQTSCASALPSFKRDEKGMRLLLSILVDALLCGGVAMYDLMSLKDEKMRRCGLKEQRSMGDRLLLLTPQFNREHRTCRINSSSTAGSQVAWKPIRVVVQSQV